jgi:hypothetical protein
MPHDFAYVTRTVEIHALLSAGHRSLERDQMVRHPGLTGVLLDQGGELDAPDRQTAWIND